MYDFNSCMYHHRRSSQTSCVDPFNHHEKNPRFILTLITFRIAATRMSVFEVSTDIFTLCISTSLQLKRIQVPQP